MTALDERLAELHRACTAPRRLPFVWRIRRAVAISNLVVAYMAECHWQLWHVASDYRARRAIYRVLYRRVLEFVDKQ